VKLYSIDIDLVLDLSEHPTDEEVVAEVTKELAVRLADGTLDGCLTITEEDEVCDKCGM